MTKFPPEALILYAVLFFAALFTLASGEGGHGVKVFAAASSLSVAPLAYLHRKRLGK